MTTPATTEKEEATPEQAQDRGEDRGDRERDRRLAELERAHARRRGPRYRSLLWRWLRGALRRPRAVVAEGLPEVVPGEISVSFAGHATLLLRYAELEIACDPMLGTWVGGVKRAVAPGLTPADLGGVSLILITNSAADHLHRPTLRRLPRSATVICPPQTAHRVSDLGFARIVELRAGESIEYRGVGVTSLGVEYAPGSALSYAIRGDGPSAFFCGVGGYSARFAEIGRRHRPDLAMLPIAGYRPASFRDRHMSPLDALSAFEDLGARILIPIRFGAFPLSYERMYDPERWLAQLVSERDLEPFVAVLTPGESRRWRSGRARAELDSQAAFDVDVDFELDIDVELAEPEPEPEPESQPEPEPEPEPQPEPEPESQPEPEPEPDVQPGRSADADLDTLLDSLFGASSPREEPIGAHQPAPPQGAFAAADSIAGAVVAATTEIAASHDPAGARDPAAGAAAGPQPATGDAAAAADRDAAPPAAEDAGPAASDPDAAPPSELDPSRRPASEDGGA